MWHFVGRDLHYRDLDRRRLRSAGLYRTAWACVLVFAFTTHADVTGAQSPDSQSGSEQALQEVTVTAKRFQEQSTLARAVSDFVASHSAPGTRINQIGRWHEPVCPLVTGLQPPARDFIIREIQDVARGVGAPTAPAGKECAVNVEIVFTREPQALLDRIAKTYRPLLGFYPASQVKQMTTFSRPIQAWYETGTRSMEIEISGHESGGLNITSFTEAMPLNSEIPLLPGGQVDSEVTAAGMQPSGSPGSHLGNRLHSDFIHVLIIADGRQLARYPMRSIADYLALLSLTRTAQLGQCAPLASITDLLGAGCAAPVASSLTAADRAYLRALYSADLEQNLNLEKGDIHEQMLRQIEKR